MKFLGRVCLIVSILFIVSGSEAIAFDTYVIHPKLAGIIAASYNQNSFDYILSAQEINWLTQGAIEEDEPIIRAFNHFYNPLKREGLKVLSIPLGLPSPEWAFNTKKQASSSGGDCSWATALAAYKQQDKPRAFKCLGHTLHLLEDVGVPAHTRNDQHAFGDPLEEWAKYHSPTVTTETSLLVPECQKADDCIIELSTWVNKNFFSKNTISDHNFLSPLNKGIHEGIYLKDGTRKLAIYNPKNNSYLLTQEIQSEYWREISPVIVLYGERLIEIFFAEIANTEEKESMLPEDLISDISLEKKLELTSNQTSVNTAPSINNQGKVGLEITPQPVSEAKNKKTTIQQLLLDDIVSKKVSNIETPQTSEKKPPDTYLLARPASTTNKTTADFIFSSDISTATFQCSINGITWINCTSPYHLTNITEGRHEIFVRAVFSNSFDQTPIHYFWIVDSTPPISVLIPSIDNNSRSASFRFYSEINSHFECKFDNFDWSECQSPKVYENLASGNHAFQVRALDVAGNREVVASGYTWQITINKPLSPSLIFPSKSPFYTSNFRLQIISDTPAETILLINNKNENISRIDNQWFSDQPLAEGENVFRLTSKNIYNEVSDPYELIVYKDSSIPTALIENLPEQYEQSQFSVNWRGFDNNSENLRYDVEFRVNEEEWQVWQANTSLLQADFTVQNLGQALSFRVRARDKAGNLSDWSNIVTTHYSAISTGHLVISQVVIKGPRGSLDEFIELYNPTNAPVYLQGYSIQKKPQIGVIWFDIVTPSLFQNIVIPSQGYLLISGHDYSYETISDIKLNEELAYDVSGHIRIVNESGEEIDRLGYGGALNPEGLATLTPDQTISLQRKAHYSSTALSLSSHPYEGNAYDSNYNLFDFVLQNVVVPRGSHNQAGPTNNFEDGLTHIWHFDECNGETFDSFNNSQSYQPLGWVVGRYGCGISQNWLPQEQINWDFDNPITSSEITISFYILNSGYGSSSTMWFLNSAGNSGIGLKMSPSGINALFNSGEISLGTTLPSFGDWHNVTLVYSRNYLGYYIDGVLNKKIVGDYRLNQSLVKLIMSQANLPWKFDEIGVWNRALSNEEVNALLSRQLSPHLQRPVQPAATLVHFWNFDNEENVVDLIGGKEIVNPEIIPGRLGKALHISWQRPLADTEISNISSEDISISYWRKKGLIGNGGGAVLITNHQTSRRFGMGGGYGESYYHFNESVEALGCYIPDDDDWHHITLVYDSYSYQIRYYIDGIERSVREQIWFWDSFDRLVMGEQQLGFAIDDLKIWEGALTPEQIAEEANLVIL